MDRLGQREAYLREICARPDGSLSCHEGFLSSVSGISERNGFDRVVQTPLLGVEPTSPVLNVLKTLGVGDTFRKQWRDVYFAFSNPML